MCGICGIYNLDGQQVNTAILERMNAAIAHRGPDGAGTHIFDHVGLGHRRLSILDLSESGKQPMQTADGRYTISYNGEVYNFKELRCELEKQGQKFKSTSDTEVVLYAFAYWGSSCIERFNGMFAFCIWDNLEKKMFLARDRYGIKPLYYTFSDNSFLFGSEQKSILANSAVKRELDYEALLEYFTFQNFFSNRTLLKNIHLFPPGSFAWIKADNRTLKPIQYWDFNFQSPEYNISEEECLEEIDRLFKQAVKRQLIADVNVSAYLSGGIDSGAITAVAANSIPYIKSFTCGFDLSSASGMELNFDERQKAELMSAHFKTEHYEMVLKAGDMERCMRDLAYHIEEPRVGQSYPNYYMAKLASKFGKVVLAGTGGDEIFGGYPWRYYRAAVNKDFESYIDKYYLFWQRLIPNKEIKKVFKPVWNEVSHVWTRDIFRDVFSKHNQELCTPEDYINHSLYFEAKTFLHGLLIVEDKLSMAHGLENRVPFLDNELVDFAMSIPIKYKLGNLNEVVRISENEPGKVKKYFQKTKDGKLILRKAIARYLPKEIVSGVKQGFSAPDASWFKGESIEYVSNMLINDDNAAIYNFLDIDPTRELIQEHLSGQCNRRLLVWSLLNVESWLKLYL